jgi:acetylornithine deacetylase/succinyl-diaminopimelate desuccinylase-like protein
MRIVARFCTVILAATTLAATAAPTDWQAKTRALFRTAVETPTVAGRKHVRAFAQYLANEFRNAGWAADDVKIIPYEGVGGADPTAALIARWRSATAEEHKPILILAHLDVVEAKREDWERDPFVLVEEDGYFYGRGTSDDKQGAIAVTSALLQLKAAGFKPQRDIVLLFTGDEETGGVGAHLAATEWRDLVDAEYALNADGGGGSFDRNGRSLGFGLQTAEKVYQSFTFTVHNRGGHSSRPRPDNAIYELASALKALENYRFAPRLIETTRAYYTERAKQEPGALGDAMRAWLANPTDGKAADVIEASELEVGTTRTRCVATRLEAGHADNALPQTARATVNCRIMPGEDAAEVLAEMTAIAGTGVAVAAKAAAKPSPASPLRSDVVNAYTKAVHGVFPDAPIIPRMSTGATDGLEFRAVGIPVYGVDGAWGVSPDDERAHGLNERLPVKALFDDVAIWMSMLRDLAG